MPWWMDIIFIFLWTASTHCFHCVVETTYNNLCIPAIVLGGNLWPAITSPGPLFNIKMPSYQYRISHCGDKTVVECISNTITADDLALQSVSAGKWNWFFRNIPASAAEMLTEWKFIKLLLIIWVNRNLPWRWRFQIPMVHIGCGLHWSIHLQSHSCLIIFVSALEQDVSTHMLSSILTFYRIMHLLHRMPLSPGELLQYCAVDWNRPTACLCQLIETKCYKLKNCQYMVTAVSFRDGWSRFY